MSTMPMNSPTSPGPTSASAARPAPGVAGSVESVQTLHIRKEIQIAAPIEIAFEALLAELGPESLMPDGKPMPFTLEAWPGGRWFRDLGAGGAVPGGGGVKTSGHWWGQVQVIKPPTLLEIAGPLFMSYPAVNFLQYRLKAESGGTLLALVHRAMGLIPEDHARGVQEGFAFGLKRVKEIAERAR